MKFTDEMFQDKIIISVFCSPEGPVTVNGVDYPDRINEEQFKMLKDCGINVVYGPEIFMDNPKSVAALFKAMDICAKLGLVYFVRDYHTDKYCWKNLEKGKDGTAQKLYDAWTEEDKAAIDAKFEENLRVYKDHPAFGGVLFSDEPGSANFPGVKAGKAVFDRVCPDKRFYVNLYPMYCTPQQFQYGQVPYDGPTDDEYTIFKYTNLQRFGHHFQQFMDIDPDIVSFDAYTYWDIAGIHNTVHRAQWDMTQYVSSECRKHGKEYWHFLQVGGRFCGEEHLRITNFGDVNLGVSIALGYGARALELFTGCTPIDYIGSNSHDGILDIFGNRTEQYPMYQYAFMQVKAIEKYLARAELKAQVVSNAPYFGLLPDAKVIRDMEDQWKGAGDTVFDGTFLPDGNIQVAEYGALKSITSTSQCIVSCFEKNGETVYFLWNNSPYAASDVTLHFDDEYVYEHTQRTVTDRSEGKDLSIYALPAGENVLVRIVGKK